MKVYIAGRYSRRDEFRVVAKQLIEMGHEVTSRWLHESTPLNHTMEDLRPSYAEASAIADLEDIDHADAVLFYSESELTPRGGRHFEMGWAAGKGKAIYVIGPRENIFHYIPTVHNITTIEHLRPAQVVGL